MTLAFTPQTFHAGLRKAHEEIAAAKWQQQRCWALAKALVDITMDRMEQEIASEFREIDNATRTALAFAREADQSTALALLNRYAARHCRVAPRHRHTESHPKRKARCQAGYMVDTLDRIDH